MDALMVCNRLKKKVSSMDRTGEVHSVFRNACNLISEDLFFTLLAKGRVMSPGSILMDTNSDFDFRSESLVQGMAFHMNGDELTFQGARLVISIAEAREWTPELVFASDAIVTDRILENLKIFEEGLCMHGRFSGMERLICQIPGLGARLPDHENSGPDASMKFISDRFAAFMKDYAAADMERLPHSCRGVLGYGPGLTPSMDDFINGLMLVNICMARFQKIQTLKVETFHKKMIAHSVDRTTRVSSEMLKSGALGFANDAVKDLMRQLFFGSRETVVSTVRKAVDYGETSGTDTALGIYAGLKFWTNHDFDFGRNIDERLCGD